MSSWDWNDPEAGYEPHERSGYLGHADDLNKRRKETPPEPEPEPEDEE